MRLQLVGGPCDGEEVFVGEAPAWYDRLETEYRDARWHRYIPVTGPEGVYRYCYLGLMDWYQAEADKACRTSPTKAIADE